jgi:hypothetical protein
MGLVHTAIRSKLGVDKVRKTTVVGMDIKREHIDAGLVQPWAHQHFEAPTSSNTTPEAGPTNFEPDNFEDILEFDELAAQLIADAAEDVDTDSDKPFPFRCPHPTSHNPAPSSCDSSCITRQHPTVTCPKNRHPIEVALHLPNRPKLTFNRDGLFLAGRN